MLVGVFARTTQDLIKLYQILWVTTFDIARCLLLFVEKDPQIQLIFLRINYFYVPTPNTFN